MFKRLFFRACLATAIFGSMAIIAALSVGTEGLVALFISCVGGIIITEKRLPNLIQQWERAGVPGGPKTPEQQEQWEQEKEQRQRTQNLSIIIGLFVAALLRSFVGDKLLFAVIVAVFGGLTGSVLRIGWLAYQKVGGLDS